MCGSYTQAVHAEQAYLFRHALLRDAAYQLQLPGDRSWLHGLALAILESSPDLSQRIELASEMADHSLEALKAEDSRARDPELQSRCVGYLLRSGRYEMGRFGHTAAESAWSRVANWESVPAASRAAAYYGLSELYERTGSILKALQCNESARALAHDAGDRRQQALCLKQLCTYLREQSSYTRCLELAGEAASIAHDLNDEDLQFECILLRCDVFLRLRQFDELEREFKVLNLLTGGQTRRLASFENMVASRFYSLANYAEAVVHFRRAYEYAQAAGMDMLGPIVLVNLADVCSYSGNNEEAFRCLSRAEELCKRGGMRRTLGMVHVSRAAILEDKGRTAEAAVDAEHGLSIAREYADKRREAICLLLMATCLGVTQAPMVALAAAREAARVSRECGEMHWAARAEMHVALMLEKQGALQEALKTADGALPVIEQAKDSDSLAQIHVLRGGLLLKLGNAREARASIALGVTLLEEAGALSAGIGFSALAQFAAAQAATGDGAGAAKSARRAMVIAESLPDVENHPVLALHMANLAALLKSCQEADP